MEWEGRINRLPFGEGRHVASEALDNVYQAFIKSETEEILQVDLRMNGKVITQWKAKPCKQAAQIIEELNS